MKRRLPYCSIRTLLRPRLLCSLALLLCLAPLAPVDAARSQASEVSIIDDRGREVRLPEPATRIVPLYGGLTDILLALGLEDEIIARTAADEAPELASRVSVGTHMRPNVELLVGLGPDLVLQMGGRKEAMLPLEAAERQGLATAFFQAHDFESLFSVIERVGALTGSDKQARDLMQDMRRRLQRVARAVAGQPRPSVFFEVRYPNLLAAGQGSMVNAVITAAGGANSVPHTDKLVRLGEEALLRLNPEFCLSQRGPMNPTPMPLKERSHFRTLDCAEQGRWQVVDERLFSRPGPGSVAAVEQLAAMLHPEQLTAAKNKEAR